MSVTIAALCSPHVVNGHAAVYAEMNAPGSRPRAASFQESRVSRQTRFLWGTGSLWSDEALQVTWYRCCCCHLFSAGKCHPTSALPREVATAGDSAARHVAGSEGSPQQPYFTRTPISRALLFSIEVTQPRSTMSRRSLVWKLGAAALSKVYAVGPWAGSFC